MWSLTSSSETEMSNGDHYLRNRKHVPCFYRVIETRVKVWENGKCCAFSSSPKLSRKYRDEVKEKQLVYFDHQNVNFLLFAPSLRVLNQSACAFALGYFLNNYNSQGRKVRNNYLIFPIFPIADGNINLMRTLALKIFINPLHF